VELIGWKARDRVRRKKSRDEKGHALSLTTQRPTKETAGEQTGAATSHNAATKPREFCECFDEDDSYGMKTIRNVLDVNHDARWGLRTRKRTEQLNGQRTRRSEGRHPQPVRAMF
jgi:hypothetical protein